MKKLAITIVVFLLSWGNSIGRPDENSTLYFKAKSAHAVNLSDSVFQNWGGVTIEVADETVTADSAIVYFKSDKIVVDAYHNVKLINNPKIIETAKSERTVNGQKLQRSSKQITAEHLHLEYNK